MRMLTKMIGSCPYAHDACTTVPTNLIQMRCCVDVCTSAVLMVVSGNNWHDAFLPWGFAHRWVDWIDHHYASLHLMACCGSVCASRALTVVRKIA